MKTKKLVCYNCGGRGFITATYGSGQTSAICPVCGGIGTREIQMTNADRIRSMTDDELNNFLCKVAYCMDTCPYEYEGKKSLGWLQQPAEEDKHEDD